MNLGRLSSYDFHLPEELVAQTPAEPRDSSRLLVMDRKGRMLQDSLFSKITDFLPANSVLVFNHSKVIPARFVGYRGGTGGRVECFLVHKLNDDSRVWKVLIKSGFAKKTGIEIKFENDLGAKILEWNEEKGSGIVEFNQNPIQSGLGQIPLPPYISAEKSKIDHSSRYQTVYAKKEGSVAAPTAGLHFTEKLIEEIKKKGHRVLEICLHVGLGTFMPVRHEELSSHSMHEEYFEISKEVANELQSAKRAKNPIVAVGTTVLRALESSARSSGSLLQAGIQKTDLFIQPGFEFKIVDSLITNFHIPKSTLLVLVSAFAERDFVLSSYQHAIEKKYRFYSYGDATLIL